VNVIENRFALTKQGNVDLRRLVRRKCQDFGALLPDEAFNAAAQSDVKEIFTSQKFGGGFLVRANGQVMSWGNSDCGQIGNGQSVGVQSMPKVIEGLNNITSLASGHGFSIARDNEGRVYSWGWNEYLSLGLGNNPPLDATCSIYKAASAPNAVSKPTLIPSLHNITQVFAFETRAFALDKEGRLYNWGMSCGRGGGGGYRSTPVLLDQPRGVRSFASNANGCFAVMADGTLVGWGFYSNIAGYIPSPVYSAGQWFGDGTDAPKEQPTPLPGLTDVREIASDLFFFYALKGDGTVWRWGGSPPGAARNGLELKTPTQITGIPELEPGKKVLIRHIKSDVEGARLFAQDGRIFSVASWAADSLSPPVYDAVERFSFIK
jgi:alpha-tubulin suppressor-like RCC1 family protein